MPVRYQHTQIGVLILAITVPITLLIAALAGSVVPLALTVLVVLVFSSLTTTVSDEAVSVRFGVGLVRRRIPLREITGASAVRNRWFYGWGIRLIPGGWLWNVSGLGAVELALAGDRRFRIGTDEPERLALAIQQARGARV